MNRGVIVFSGFNQRAVIAFLRTLESRDVQYAIIASSSSDPVLKTKYKDKVVITRDKIQLEMNDILNCIRVVKNQKKFDYCMVAPSSEALNRFFLNNRTVFSEIKVEIPLVDKELYIEVSNKESFGELCRSNGILIPGEYSSIKQASLPCVAKPKKYISPNGEVYSPILLHSVEELEEFKRKYNETYFYYQEFIVGDSFYLLYYFRKDGSVSKYSQQNLVQQPGGKSIIAAVGSNFHETTESHNYETMFKKIGFRGLVMVEIKKSMGKSYMIEANPRFWGPSQLFVDAGNNFFEDLLIDNGFSVNKNISLKPREARYFWYGGLCQSGVNNVTFHGLARERFNSEIDKWMTSDVYNRKDTRELYRTEID